MSTTEVVKLIGEVGVLIGMVTPLLVNIHNVKEGVKCQLRKDMLDIYYDNRDTKVIRQYEYENFVHLYEAYKALKGNSFIDKIYEEVRCFEIVN